MKWLNETIERFARDKILDGLLGLPDGCHRKFKQMYSFDDMDKSIKAVVRDMPAEKLNWALTQVERSVEIEKNRK